MSQLRLFTALLGILCLPVDEIFAQNRFIFEDQTVRIDTDTVRVPFLLDTTEVRHALSISVAYDQTNLEFVDIDSTGTDTENADWSVGLASQADGVLIWSFVMGLSVNQNNFDPDKVIPVGNGRTAANIDFNLIAPTVGSASIAFVDNQAELPGYNRMVTEGTRTDPTLGSATITIEALPTFIRGDADEDGLLDITDAMVNLFTQFGILPPSSCEDRLDSDDDGVLTINDAVLVLEHLYNKGAAPEAPFPGSGVDPTSDSLNCD